MPGTTIAVCAHASCPYPWLTNSEVLMTEPRQAAPPVPIDRVRDSSDDIVFRLLVEKIRDYAIFVLDPRRQRRYVERRSARH